MAWLQGLALVETCETKWHAKVWDDLYHNFSTISRNMSHPPLTRAESQMGDLKSPCAWVLACPSNNDLFYHFICVKIQPLELTNIQLFYELKFEQSISHAKQLHNKGVARSVCYLEHREPGIALIRLDQYRPVIFYLALILIDSKSCFIYFNWVLGMVMTLKWRPLRELGIFLWSPNLTKWIIKDVM